MAGEIFDVNISLRLNTGQILGIEYATKCNFKRYMDTKTTNTHSGDVSTGAYNTGADISIEGLNYPTSVEDSILLEDALDPANRDVFILDLTVSGTSYTKLGSKYKRTITGSGVTVSTDDEDWPAGDAMSDSLEFKVDHLTKINELL
jgi:hypothetical protein